MTDSVRPMFAQPSRHRKRCDMSRCTSFAVIDFRAAAETSENSTFVRTV